MAWKKKSFQSRRRKSWVPQKVEAEKSLGAVEWEREGGNKFALHIAQHASFQPSSPLSGISHEISKEAESFVGQKASEEGASNIASAAVSEWKVGSLESFLFIA